MEGEGKEEERLHLEEKLSSEVKREITTETHRLAQTHTQVHIPYWLKPSCPEVYPVAVVMDGEVMLLLGALFSPSASTDCES